MQTLTTASDLQAWAEARLTRPFHQTPQDRLDASPPDAWLDAAATLRHAALGVSGIVGLSESAAFQTRGRGPAVFGVALAPLLRGGAMADVAVIVDADVMEGPSRLTDVAGAVESCLYATWERMGDPYPLTVAVHVVDLAARRQALRAVRTGVSA